MEEIHEILRESKERGYVTRKYTRRNPNGTYRLSASADGDLFNIRLNNDTLTVTGDVINALGWWENWDVTPERAEQLFLSHNIKRSTG